MAKTLEQYKEADVRQQRREKLTLVFVAYVTALLGFIISSWVLVTGALINHHLGYTHHVAMVGVLGLALSTFTLAYADMMKEKADEMK